MTTLRIFLWKHWKCFHYSWIKNILMIVVPIAIVWFQIHVSSGHTNGMQRIFDPIKAVNYYYVILTILLAHYFAQQIASLPIHAFQSLNYIQIFVYSKIHANRSKTMSCIDFETSVENRTTKCHERIQWISFKCLGDGICTPSYQHGSAM